MNRCYVISSLVHENIVRIVDMYKVWISFTLFWFVTVLVHSTTACTYIRICTKLEIIWLMTDKLDDKKRTTIRALSYSLSFWVPIVLDRIFLILFIGWWWWWWLVLVRLLISFLMTPISVLLRLVFCSCLLFAIVVLAATTTTTHSPQYREYNR